MFVCSACFNFQIQELLSLISLKLGRAKRRMTESNTRIKPIKNNDQNYLTDKNHRFFSTNVPIPCHSPFFFQNSSLTSVDEIKNNICFNKIIATATKISKAKGQEFRIRQKLKASDKSYLFDRFRFANGRK